MITFFLVIKKNNNSDNCYYIALYILLYILCYIFYLFDNWIGLYFRENVHTYIIGNFCVLGASTIGEKDSMVHETIKILSDYEQLHVLNEVNVGH